MNAMIKGFISYAHNDYAACNDMKSICALSSVHSTSNFGQISALIQGTIGQLRSPMQSRLHKFMFFCAVQHSFMQTISLIMNCPPSMRSAPKAI